MKRGLRLFYAAGPGDIIGTYRHWKEGRDDPSQVALTYSAQFYDVCRAVGGEGLAIATHPRTERLRDGSFDVRHVSVPFVRKSGPLFHLGQVWHNLKLIASAWAFRADVAVIAGVTHWYVFHLLRLSGTRIVPALHCVLWHKFRDPSRIHRVLGKLDATLFRRSAAIMSASADITEQMDRLLGVRHGRLLEFLPTYRRETFAGVPAADPARRPFRVLYAGRIEPSKGVFDLLEIVKRCEAERPGRFEWRLCGTGSALEALRREVEAAGLAGTMALLGHVDRERMRSEFTEAHAVIVPTRTDFIEGFNQVVSEAVLAGRPCITSPVCPALAEVREATVVVPPDDVEAYAKAVLDLEADGSLYAGKRAACAELSGRFYDEAEGWAATLHRVLGAVPTAMTPVSEVRASV